MNPPAQGFRTIQASARRRQAGIRERIEQTRRDGAATLETPITRGDRLHVAYHNGIRQGTLVSWTAKWILVQLDGGREVKLLPHNILKRGDAK